MADLAATALGATGAGLEHAIHFGVAAFGVASDENRAFAGIEAGEALIVAAAFAIAWQATGAALADLWATIDALATEEALIGDANILFLLGASTGADAATCTDLR